jgi:hypothetical protein
MDSNGRYRKLAHDCLRLSLGADTAEERASLIRMAETWLRLADSAPKLEQMVNTALTEARQAGSRSADR